MHGPAAGRAERRLLHQRRRTAAGALRRLAWHETATVKSRAMTARACSLSLDVSQASALR